MTPTYTYDNMGILTTSLKQHVNNNNNMSKQQQQQQQQHCHNSRHGSNTKLDSFFLPRSTPQVCAAIQMFVRRTQTINFLSTTHIYRHLLDLLDLLDVSTCGQKRHTRYQVKRENCLSEQHNHNQIKWSTAANWMDDAVTDAREATQRTC